MRAAPPDGRGSLVHFYVISPVDVSTIGFRTCASAGPRATIQCFAVIGWYIWEPMDVTEKVFKFLVFIFVDLRGY